ncbi:MAG: RdgB/HAM1 family non-canonical purine NTP pyrophosphatase [Clostridiales bacterium]|nr:RdgB/HAM1 family non-canonical purine NTP pyrophosphatase [Clostridiales bacterium]
MKKQIVLATGNKGKLNEFRAILKDYEILTPRELNVDFDVEETGETFYDNALIKARALYEICKLPTLADDSGLCVDALGGAPGVFSARYSGGNDKDNIDKLLNELSTAKGRKAHFSCCIVYYDGASVVSATGETHGIITREVIGNGGFGYDPVFLSDDLGKTFGEASEDEKNKISHRARALAQLADILHGKA